MTLAPISAASTSGCAGLETPAEPRWWSRLRVELEGQLAFRQPIAVFDISPVAMGFQTPEWLGVGRRYTFRLGPEGLIVSGAVARCRLARLERLDDGSAQPVYEAGVVFELSPGRSEQLAALFERLSEDSSTAGTGLQEASV